MKLSPTNLSSLNLPSAEQIKGKENGNLRPLSSKRPSSNVTIPPVYGNFGALFPPGGNRQRDGFYLYFGFAIIDAIRTSASEGARLKNIPFWQDPPSIYDDAAFWRDVPWADQTTTQPGQPCSRWYIEIKRGSGWRHTDKRSVEEICTSFFTNCRGDLWIDEDLDGMVAALQHEMLHIVARW